MAVVERRRGDLGAFSSVIVLLSFLVRYKVPVFAPCTSVRLNGAYVLHSKKGIRVFLRIGCPSIRPMSVIIAREAYTWGCDVNLEPWASAGSRTGA